MPALQTEETTAGPTEEEIEAHLVATELFTLEAEDDDIASDSEDGHDHPLTASPATAEVRTACTDVKNDEKDQTQHEGTHPPGTQPCLPLRSTTTSLFEAWLDFIPYIAPLTLSTCLSCYGWQDVGGKIYQLLVHSAAACLGVFHQMRIERIIYRKCIFQREQS